MCIKTVQMLFYEVSTKSAVAGVVLCDARYTKLYTVYDYIWNKKD